MIDGKRKVIDILLDKLIPTRYIVMLLPDILHSPMNMMWCMRIMMMGIACTIPVAVGLSCNKRILSGESAWGKRSSSHVKSLELLSMCTCLG